MGCGLVWCPGLMVTPGLTVTIGGLWEGLSLAQNPCIPDCYKSVQVRPFSLGFPKDAAILPMPQEKSTFWSYILGLHRFSATVKRRWF